MPGTVLKTSSSALWKAISTRVDCVVRTMQRCLEGASPCRRQNICTWARRRMAQRLVPQPEAELPAILSGS